MKPDTAAIRKLYLERSDSLDASSYDVQGLCGRVEELEALLAEAAEALAGSRCHNCYTGIGDGIYAGCRTCRPTRALLERLRGRR